MFFLFVCFVFLLLVFSNELLFLYPESVIGFRASKEQGPCKWIGCLLGTLSSSQLSLSFCGDKVLCRAREVHHCRPLGAGQET